LTIGPSITDTSSHTDFGFEYNYGIKFLYLTRIIKCDHAEQPWLLRFLSNIGKSNRIEEINLEVDIPDCHVGPVEWSDWEEVDSILAGAHFESLRKLDIVLWPRAHSFRESCRNLVCMLPLVHARGVSVDVVIGWGSRVKDGYDLLPCAGLPFA
jgi:hypothetical protein